MASVLLVLFNRFSSLHAIWCVWHSRPVIESLKPKLFTAILKSSAWFDDTFNRPEPFLDVEQ